MGALFKSTQLSNGALHAPVEKVNQLPQHYPIARRKCPIIIVVIHSFTAHKMVFKILIDFATARVG